MMLMFLLQPCHQGGCRVAVGACLVWQVGSRYGNQERNPTHLCHQPLPGQRSLQKGQRYLWAKPRNQVRAMVFKA